MQINVQIMQWFFNKDLTGNIIGFDAEESKHCVRVLRLKQGDQIKLTDGNGTLASATLIDDNIKKCTIRVDEIKNFEKPWNYSLQIAVSPTKNIARFEWFCEKATEIGIDKIIPLQCEHSERIHINYDRLKKILISAMKQSQQPWLPELSEMMTFSKLIKSNFPGQKFIAYVDENHQNTLKNTCQPNKDVIILIGPEGDFSKEEIQTAISSEFDPVSLGPNRLRTETAAIVACHTIALINQK